MHHFLLLPVSPLSQVYCCWQQDSNAEDPLISRLFPISLFALSSGMCSLQSEPEGLILMATFQV